MATPNTPAPPTSDPSVVARLASKRDKWKAETLKEREARTAAEKERDDLKQQLEGLKGSGDRVKELEGRLRTQTHRATFDRLALARGAAAEDLDDLFALSGYKAEGDAPDEKAIGRLLDDQKAHPARKKYFAPPGDDDDDRADDEKEAEPAARREAPDAGRGKRGDGKGTVHITRDQLADPKFMLDPKNKDLIRSAKVRA